MGEHSWGQFPALWMLKHVDSLPNPDPMDITMLDENPVAKFGRSRLIRR